MTNIISINAQTRDNTGKGAARTIRRAGMIPAIIYGKNKESINIQLDERAIGRYYKKANFLSILMNIELNGQNYHVIPKEVQLHPVTDNAEHIDFLHILDESQVKVTVHLHFINEDKCLGIKRGGLLNLIKRDVELLCLAKSIPSSIEVDVINLNIGDNIHLNDLKLPDGVKATSSENYTIATLIGRNEDTDKEESAVK